MKFPYYYTFSEFEKNYVKTLKEWLEIFPDGTESDFAYEYKRNVYDRFFLPYRDTFEYKIKIKTIDDEKEIQDRTVYIDEFAKIVESRVRVVLSLTKHTIPTEEDITTILHNELMYDNPDREYFLFHKDGYIVEYEDTVAYEHLFKYDFSNYEKSWFLHIDFDEYRGFKYSIIKIFKYLSDKINNTIPSYDSTNMENYITSPESDIITSRKSVAYKLELLRFSEFMQWLNTNIGTKEDQYKILAEIIQCSAGTVKDYLTNKKPILKEHSDRAQNFINSKRN